MKISAVIFDMDGTIVDSIGVWRKMNKKYLKTKNRNYKKDIYKELDTGNTIFQGAAYFKKRYNLPDSVNEIVGQWTQMMLPYYKKFKLKPNCKQTLIYLKQRGIRVGLGTSNSSVMAKEFFLNNKITSYFDIIVGGEQVVNGKPFPDIFLEVARCLSVNCEEILVVEDSPSGIIAAKSANMKVIAIKDECMNFEKTSKMADYHCEDFHQLKTLIESLLTN